MGLEIERKFLVNGRPWRGKRGTEMIQGYLVDLPWITVRVRIAGTRAWLTIKGPGKGALVRARPEFEFGISRSDALSLLKIFGGRQRDSKSPQLVTKRRYRLNYRRSIWEVDVFSGSNRGLVIAEIELTSASAKFARPPWLADEVTRDPKYLNSNLAKRPFSTW